MNVLAKRFIVLIICGLLAACSSNSASNNSANPNQSATDDSASASPETGKVVEITYWHFWTNDWKKVIDGLVDEFNQAHPNIHVKSVSVADDIATKFLTAQAGGDPPDVMTYDGFAIPSWAEKNAILPLDDFLSADAPDLKTWMYPAVAQMGSYNGKLYAAAFSMDAHAMFYNKDIFREVGLDPENPPQTIEELDAIQDKLWKKDARGFIERIGYMPSWYMLWVTAFGGQWIDEQGKPTATNENNIKALEWFQSYANKYDATKIAAFNKSQQGATVSANPFLSGKQAMTMDGMWALLEIKQYAPDMDYGVYPMPYPANGGKQNADLIGGNFNIIPAKAKHPKEAWEFIKWLTGYHNEEWAAGMLAKGGWIPPSPEITKVAAYQAYLDEIPLRHIFVDTMASPNASLPPYIPELQYYQDRIGAAEEAVMTLKKKPKQALEDVQKEIEKEMAKK